VLGDYAMLIQISDPKASKTNTPSQYAIGIDFGTTYCVAGVIRDNLVELIPLEGEAFLLPSIVSYQSTETIVGAAANKALDSIHSIKRIMGRSASEIETILSHHPFVIAHTDEGIQLKTEQGLKYPVEVASTIFRHIKIKAADYLKQDIEDVVVTVPAYFDEVARTSIKDAARLAGLNVLRLIAEPTAAALAYGLDNAKEGTYVVYDLGGGTFDVSILKMTHGVFQVLATGGDPFLGGDDIDAMIVDYFLKDISLTSDQRRDALLHACQVKEKLSSQIKATFDTPLGDRCVLKQEVFESLIDSFVTRTLNITKDTLHQSGSNLDEIQGIILVGGSTRIPKIQKALSDNFKVPIFQSFNPDEVVARGAAEQAHLLTYGGDNVLIDVAPLSLGIEIMGGVVDKIIPRNSPIPIQKGQNFTTFQDNQTSIMINVVQGERELAEDCRSLGTFILSGIPPMPAGLAKIKVIFALDADGLLTVSAKEENVGIIETISVKPSYGLSEATIQEMILESHAHAQEDMEARLLNQAKSEANQLIQIVKQALEVDSDLLIESEKILIENAINNLSEVLVHNDRKSIRANISQLNHLTTEFAHKRVQKYLKTN
jgi:molecular chaperone HscA